MRLRDPQLLQEHMRGADYTQARLARAAGTSRQFVHMLIRGDRTCTPLVGARIEAALGVQPGTLFETRTAAEVAKTQIAVTPQKAKELRDMKGLCDQALDYLTNHKTSLDDFGKLLNEQWQIKRSLTDSISNPKIDEIYHTGIKYGALGGKLLGAGGGGFMLFYAPKENQAAIQAALDKKMFVPFRFDFTGSKIIYYSHE